MYAYAKRKLQNETDKNIFPQKPEEGENRNEIQKKQVEKLSERIFKKMKYCLLPSEATLSSVSAGS